MVEYGRCKEGMIVMIRRIQFGKEVVLTDRQRENSRILKYSVTESPVGFGYSDLKCYGVEVEKTDKKPGMRDIRECKSIDGIFFDIEEAISFLSLIKRNRVVPTELSHALEKYIKDKIKMSREQTGATSIN